MPDLGDRTQFHTTDNDNITISNGQAAPRIDAQLRKLAGAVARRFDFLGYKADDGSASEIYINYPQDDLEDLHEGQPINFSRTADSSSSSMQISLDFGVTGERFLNKGVAEIIGGTQYTANTAKWDAGRLIKTVWKDALGVFIAPDISPVSSSGTVSGNETIRFPDGTQIIWGQTTITTVANVPTFNTINFGASAFISTSTMAINVTANIVATNVVETMYQTVTTTSVAIGVHRTTANNTIVSYVVIGRWF